MGIYNFDNLPVRTYRQKETKVMMSSAQRMK